MIVTSISGNMFLCEDDDLSFKVGFLPGKVAMYGDAGSQMFAYDGPPTIMGLKEVFRDRAAAKKCATLHTRGVVDRMGFIEDIRRLHKEGSLVHDQLKQLEAFIRSCNCAPARVFKRLFDMGYTDLPSKVRIYEETPIFKQTIDYFMEFLDAAS